MSEYQPIYDAVCSRLGHPDIAGTIERVARDAFDISHLWARANETITAIEHDMRRPTVLLRPRVFLDGNQWCVLYGDNIQDGVAGFGDTPDLASYAFDRAWNSQTAKKQGCVTDAAAHLTRELNKPLNGLGGLADPKPMTAADHERETEMRGESREERMGPT